jgi:quercetin dioxygenase-like cupin family protein
MTPELAAISDLDGRPHAHVFPESEPRTVRLELDAGERVPTHQHPDRDVVCHVIDGELDVTLGDSEVTVSAGEVARFDGAQDISPEATEASTALLVLAQKG